MNPETEKEAKALFLKIKKGIKNIKNAEVVLCPPFLYLPVLANIQPGKIFLGSQNCFWEEKGAFTGEISALMLKDFKVKYIILGHSERRKYFNETNELINKKIKKALDEGLKVIFCAGETAEEKSSGKKLDALGRQLREGLKNIPKNKINGISIAYEPVWSIGTGNNCSVEETMTSVLSIRKIIADLYGRKSATGMRILYGGSVNSKNAGHYIKESKANGLLAGGASTNAEEFIKIVKSSEP